MARNAKETSVLSLPATHVCPLQLALRNPSARRILLHLPSTPQSPAGSGGKASMQGMEPGLMMRVMATDNANMLVVMGAQVCSCINVCVWCVYTYIFYL